MGRRIIFRLAVVIGIALLGFSNIFSAQAANYPNKPLTIIAPTTPGGLFDTAGRPLVLLLEKQLGQPIVFLNKPGATFQVGSTIAAKAPADGYTLLFSGGALHLALEWEIFNGRKPTVSLDDFTPLGTFTFTPTVVVVPFDSPWKNLEDLIRDLKAKPGFYSFSSGGLYGNTHVPNEILQLAAGIPKPIHVPFGGGGEAVTALVGKHVDYATLHPGNCISLIRGGKLRALAVQGDKRLKELPDVPTVKELGIDAEFYNWSAILVRKQTPVDIVKKLKVAFKNVVSTKEYVMAVEAQGQDVFYMPGEELEKYWVAEKKTIRKIYTGIKEREKGSKP
jgi:tripartite-type tricarboxylate transporter receptor subunit TctC